MKDPLFENPKRFWSFIKSTTGINQQPNFLRDGQKFVTDGVCKANLLNRFFISVFSPSFIEPPDTLTSPPIDNQFTEIQLTVAEVAGVLRSLDVNKSSGPDGIPNRLLVNVADEIAPSLCRLFNLSLSLGVIPANWKFANITACLRRMIQHYRQTIDLSPYLAHYPRCYRTMRI